MKVANLLCVISVFFRRSFVFAKKIKEWVEDDDGRMGVKAVKIRHYKVGWSFVFGQDLDSIFLKKQFRKMSLKLSKIVCYLFKYKIPNRIPILWSPLARFIFVPSWGYDSPLTRVQSSHHDSTKLRSRKKFGEVRWVNAELRSYLHYVVASEIPNLLEASIVEFFCTMYGKGWQTYALQNALSCPLHNSIINREG